MNERIKEIARRSGATDQNGSMATTVFCFTEMELDNFAELIIKECLHNMENCDGDLDFAIWKTKQHFGVES